MAEEKIDIAKDFAEFTDSSVTIDNESTPNENSEDLNLQINEPENDSSDMRIKYTETPKEEVSEEKTDSSLTKDSSQQDVESNESNESDQQSESETEQNSEVEEKVVGDEDALFVLNEKYGTDYENLDDLLDDLEREEEQQFANEQMAQLNKFVSETGRSPEDYIKTQTRDYTKMSDKDVIKEYLSIENPDLSKDEIDLFFDSTYKANKDKYSEEESKLGNIHLKRDVAKAREELVELQKEYWSPLDNKGPSEEETQERERAEAESRENFLDAMDSELDDIESLSFQINDKGETFEYKLTDEDKGLVGEALSDLDGFFEPYVNENGEWDLESLALDMMAMKLQDKIVRSVANQYKSQGAEQVIRDIKNPSFEPAKVSSENKGKSVADQIGSAIFGDSTMWD